MSLKRVLLFSLCILVLSGLVGCRETEITVKSKFVERFPELSLFYGLSSPLGSEMICIFPYFCPCEEIRKGNKGNFYLGIARYLIKKSCGIPLCFSC